MIEDLIKLYSCRPRVTLAVRPLSGNEDRVSDAALRGMVGSLALIGPFKPCRPFVLSIWGRMWASLRGY